MKCGASLLGLALATRALGQVSLVSTAFTGSDSILWANNWPIKVTFSTPATGVTTLGHGFTVNDAGGAAILFQQGKSWFGNFTPGDVLLYTGGGPITISGLDANEVGAFAAPNYTPNNGLPMYLSAYHGATLLGTVSEDMTESENFPPTPPSATFLGISSSQVITSVVYSFPVANFQPQHLAIDTLELKSYATPEPSAALVFGVGLIAMLRRRKPRF